MNDVMFSHNGANGPESKMTHAFRLVYQIATHTLGRSMLCPTASCFRAAAMCNYCNYCRSIVRRCSTGTVKARSKLSRSLPADIFHLPYCHHISSCHLSQLEGAYVFQPSCNLEPYAEMPIPVFISNFIYF